jgi:hypothetical protein
MKLEWPEDVSLGPEFGFVAVAGFGFLEHPRPPAFAVPAPPVSAFAEPFIAMNIEYGSGQKPVRPEFSFAVVGGFGFLKQPRPAAFAVPAPPFSPFPEPFVATKIAEEGPLQPELAFALVGFVLLTAALSAAASSSSRRRRRSLVWRRWRRPCRRLGSLRWVARCLQCGHGVDV